MVVCSRDGGKRAFQRDGGNIGGMAGIELCGGMAGQRREQVAALRFALSGVLNGVFLHILSSQRMEL